MASDYPYLVWFFVITGFVLRAIGSYRKDKCTSLDCKDPNHIITLGNIFWEVAAMLTAYYVLEYYHTNP